MHWAMSKKTNLPVLCDKDEKVDAVVKDELTKTSMK
jgi:hypothetical protein